MTTEAASAPAKTTWLAARYSRPSTASGLTTAFAVSTLAALNPTTSTPREEPAALDPSEHASDHDGRGGNKELAAKLAQVVNPVTCVRQTCGYAAVLPRVVGSSVDRRLVAAGGWFRSAAGCASRGEAGP